MRTTKGTVIGGCLLLLLAIPALSRAGDWARVPSNGGDELVAPSSGDDGQVIADFLARIKGSQSNGERPCELIGMFADMMAIARDQGITRESLRSQLDSSFRQKAAEKHIPLKWVRPFQTVVDSQVDYVFDHPRMSAERAQVNWTHMCQSQGGE